LISGKLRLNLWSGTPYRINQYRKITIEETGKVGSLFYSFIISFILALIFAIIGILLKITT